MQVILRQCREVGRMYLVWMRHFALVIYRTWHLARLKPMPHRCSHLSRVKRSFCRVIDSELIARFMAVSSEKSLTLDLTWFDLSQLAPFDWSITHLGQFAQVYLSQVNSHLSNFRTFSCKRRNKSEFYGGWTLLTVKYGLSEKFYYVIIYDQANFIKNKSHILLDMND